MTSVSDLLNLIYESVINLSLDTSLYIAWGAYGGIFLVALALTLFNAGMRRADKRVFLSFTNAFTAVTLALMLTEKDVTFSVLTAVLFWCAGYILYGLLALISKRGAARRKVLPSAAIAATNAGNAAPPRDMFKPAAPPVRGNVRLDHAVSVTEKLLAKELGRSDRQEVERIKTALSVMILKSELSPEENERLNDHFNTLLKLMAKYNV